MPEGISDNFENNLISRENTELLLTTSYSEGANIHFFPICSLI